MNPLSAIIGAGASLIGSFMNSSSQNAINNQMVQLQQQQLQQNEKDFQQSFAFNKDQATGVNLGPYYANMVSGAKAAGLSPLAVMGIQNNASAPTAVGSSLPNLQSSSPGEGLSQAGRILSQMQLPGADAPSKLDQLQAQLLEAQIARTNSETVGNQIRNSHLAVATQPGVRPGSDPAHAIPMWSYFKDETGAIVRGQSKDFADTQFGLGSWPSGVASGAYSLGGTVSSGARAIGSDLKSLYEHVRPDWTRFFSQTSGQ